MAIERPLTRSDATGIRILDAAWELVRERGLQNVRVADVADAAGVSRQSIYLHFENRTGLLAEMTRRHDDATGFVDRVSAVCALPDPVDALEHLCREWFAYLPDILPVATALEAAGSTDPAGAAAWQMRMGDLRDGFRILISAIAERGSLADGWTVERATDWVWGRTHVTEWRHLVVERGWDAEEYAERTVRSVVAEIVRPTPGTS